MTIIDIIGVTVAIICGIGAASSFYISMNLYTSECDIYRLKEEYKDNEAELKLALERAENNNKKSENLWRVMGGFLLAIAVSLMITMLLDEADKSYGTEESYTISVTVLGKRAEISDNDTRYYVSLSNGIEYKVKGQDYSILEKGDSVNVVYHDVTGRITGEHYKWSDMG
jgi:hypothetical protein